MKRIIILCISLLLLFALYSCGNKPAKDEISSDQPVQTIQQGDIQQTPGLEKETNELEEESKQPTYEALHDQGMKFLEAENSTEAISAFQSAIAIDKAQPDAYIQLHTALLEAENPQQAMYILFDGYHQTRANEIANCIEEFFQRVSAQMIPTADLERHVTVFDLTVPYEKNDIFHQEYTLVLFDSLTGSTQALASFSWYYAETWEASSQNITIVAQNDDTWLIDIWVGEGSNISFLYTASTNTLTELEPGYNWLSQCDFIWGYTFAYGAGDPQTLNQYNWEGTLQASWDCCGFSIYDETLYYAGIPEINSENQRTNIYSVQIDTHSEELLCYVENYPHGVVFMDQGQVIWQEENTHGDVAIQSMYLTDLHNIDWTPAIPESSPDMSHFKPTGDSGESTFYNTSWTMRSYTGTFSLDLYEDGTTFCRAYFADEICYTGTWAYINGVLVIDGDKYTKHIDGEDVWYSSGDDELAIELYPS